MLALLIATIIFAWAIYGLHVLDLHRPALQALCKPVADWFAEPGNPVTAGLWVSSIILCIASWLSPEGTLFNSMLPDFIVISLSVIGIDRLVEYRNYLQRKQEIIDQIESPVSDVAVEAIRLAGKHKFLDEALRKVHLRGHDLHGANFKGVKIQRFNVTGANLQDAVFTNAELQGTSFRYAILYNAIFAAANLQDTHFEGAKLQGANLRAANLEEANMRNAKLQGADFTFANNLEKTDFKRAVYDNFTQWPNGFDPEAAGAIRVDD